MGNTQQNKDPSPTTPEDVRPIETVDSRHEPVAASDPENHTSPEKRQNGSKPPTNLFQAFWLLISKSRYRHLWFTGALLITLAFAFWVSVPDATKARSFEVLLQAIIPGDAGSFDPEAYNAGAFEILSKETLLDLTLRQHVDEVNRKEVRVSPAKWVTSIEVQKITEAPRFFLKELWTSGMTPDVIAFTHPYAVQQLPYVPSAGRMTLRKYGLFIDVSREPPNKPFTIRYQYIFWNSFQSQTEEWAAAPIKHATKSLKFEILAPHDKEFKSVKAYMYPTRSDRIELYTGPDRPVLSPAKLTWKVTTPVINHSYRLLWNW